jgi:hypothetical protein
VPLGPWNFAASIRARNLNAQSQQDGKVPMSVFFRLVIIAITFLVTDHLSLNRTVVSSQSTSNGVRGWRCPGRNLFWRNTRWSCVSRHPIRGPARRPSALEAAAAAKCVDRGT